MRLYASGACPTRSSLRFRKGNRITLEKIRGRVEPMSKFCPVCGAQGQKLVGALCEKCFWEDVLEDFPGEFKLTVCSVCFCYLQGKRWVRRRESTNEDKVIESAKQEFLRSLKLPEGVKLDGMRGSVVETAKSGLPSVVELEITLLYCDSMKEVKSRGGVEFRQCYDCSCLSSGKYEALVQVRAEDRKLDNEDRILVERALDNFFKWTEDRGRSDISEIKDKEGGLDIKFLSANMAKLFTKELSSFTGADVVESARIMGIDKSTGGQHFRTTISIKMPKVRVGELLESGGIILRVAGYHRGRTVVENLAEPGRKRALSESQEANSRKIRFEDVRMVRLESKSGSFGTFLDTTDKKFFELPSELIPADMSPGETGMLITVGGRYRLYKKGV